ncbi:YciI family protein [Demequina globuliformis]|uniref:YciI family protein n=1 Tax=Demequina globuliformis TaxID=676202 RepID=UPI0007825C2C|nr:YciI family protein [Demequina globuliformis]
MTTWMIEYTYDDQDAARDEHRPAHRAYLATLADAGSMPAYGRFTDEGPAGALLVARAGTKGAVEDMVRADPFVKAGLVAEYRIREWPAVWEQR